MTSFRNRVSLVLAATLASMPAANGAAWQDELAWGEQRVTITREGADAGPQVFHFALKEPGGEGGKGSLRGRDVPERSDGSRVRTGNALFDGLYALALEEARQDSVAQIRDDAFNGGRPMPCECFTSGAKWTYVWTRDISYSVDLGLGWLDPLRARNSLLFKQSGVRPDLLAQGVAAGQFIAQDTGSGGSWPVSTDRVVWIHAAFGLLAQLPAVEARALEAQLMRVAADTLAQDREYAFDAHTGLYRGETSFLDWREQTYPQWTRNDTLYITESYAFSTNVLHYIALRDAAELAQRRHDRRGVQYRQQAAALRVALNARFWREDAGLYASYLGPGLNPPPAAAADLLGLSLAIIHGVADERQAKRILQNYPVTTAGPPVVWPEQQDVLIYHNRALWPFVTAYALQAAKRAGHAELATRHAESLMRGAALSLSNYELFEFLTQRSAFADGALSLPHDNSARQLWSVAAYLNMVVDTLFGISSDAGGVHLQPFLPGRLAHELFGGQREIALHGWSHAGARINVTLQLPSQWSDAGWLEADAPRTLRPAQLVPGAELTEYITLVEHATAPQPLRVLQVADAHALTTVERHTLFAPRQPQLLAATRVGAKVELKFSGLEPGSDVQVYRNGLLLANVGEATEYTDVAGAVPDTLCYFVTQRYRDTGLVSLPSREYCLPVEEYTRRFAAADGSLVSPDQHLLATLNGRAQFVDWGTPGQELRLSYTAPSSGLQQLRVEYASAQGPINTGITAAQKRVIVQCAGSRAQEGSVVMPHLPDWNAWGVSSRYVFQAKRGQACTIALRDGFNMSYLEHFRLYTGGRGGASGPLNRANIAAVQIELLRAQ